jgi:hypothetical protein
MGSGAIKKLAASNNSVLDRLKTLEDNNVRLMQALQQSFETSDKMLKNVAEILSAVVSVVGPDTITQAVESARQAVRDEQILKAKVALEGLVADGTAVATDTVGDASLVVGHETLPDGTDSGRLQFLISDLAEDRKASLVGKGVGFVIDFPSGAKFEINEIYNIVEKPAENVKLDGPVVDLRNMVENDLATV